MLRIGLLGGTSWESSAEYYRLLNEGVKARLGGKHSADLILRSLDFADVCAMQEADDWAGLAALYAAQASALAAAGAQVLGICANTMHLVHADVVRGSGLPVVHVVDVDELPLEQVTKQLNKLINVIKIVELEQDSSVQRELLLVKVRAELAIRSHVLEVVELFRARVVDVVPDAVTIEATGGPGKLDALLAALEPFGIREIVQSGTVAIGRGPRSITDRALERVSRSA